MNNQLKDTLKEYFGYDSFRPHQLDIISATLSGRDVLAILPTGAGKSLCYQLPALLSPGVTLVISPLIALMKDQVDSLRENGISSGALYSGLEISETDRTLAALEKGELKLLYVAPERAITPTFTKMLGTIEISRIVVDEAHCISSWGHDFRPEYRELALLRQAFPAAPVMAVTATAIPQVRSDICDRLALKDKREFIASFNRPNLIYRVTEKTRAFEQLTTFLSNHEDEPGIVYCLSRASTEEVSEELREKGFNAAPYHAGLESQQRAETQERFLRDDIQIICATIAFGMGVNKPNVRFVVHYDLPKNIESYYQETGRAGRDGLPSECLLLFGSGDQVKLRYFIDQLSDETIRHQAEKQLRAMVQYAQSPVCRRKVLLGYFGEHLNQTNCDGCDVCLGEVELVDETVASQKFLSSVARVAQKASVSFGINHHAAILAGDGTPAVEKWGHRELSTFGIGSDRSSGDWARLGRMLVAHGYLARAEGKYETVALSQQGRDFLKAKSNLRLPKAKEIPRYRQSKIKSGRPINNELFEKLRALRRSIAKERNVPAFMIFGDATLHEIAKSCPKNETDFLGVTGVGAKKLADFGARFLEITKSHQPAAALSPAEISSPREVNTNPGASWKRSYDLFIQGKDPVQIADLRGISASSVWDHLEKALLAGAQVDISRLVSNQERTSIDAGVEQVGFDKLKPLKELLGESVSYEMLRWYRSWIQCQSRTSATQTLSS